MLAVFPLVSSKGEDEGEGSASDSSRARARRMPRRLESVEWGWIARASALYRSLPEKSSVLRAGDCLEEGQLNSDRARRRFSGSAIFQSSDARRIPHAGLIRYRDRPQMEKCRAQDRCSPPSFSSGHGSKPIPAD